MDKVFKAPFPVCLLTDRKAFIKRVVEHSTNTNTYREAWERTENELEQAFGVRRYSSYESFRVSKCREQSELSNRGRG